MTAQLAQSLGITYHDLRKMFKGEMEIPAGFQLVTKTAGEMTEEEDTNFAVVTQWNEKRSDWHRWSWLEPIA
jgi:predicted transcriptional regulator